MTNNPTIDGVSRELLERLTRPIRKATDEADRIDARKELRAILDADHSVDSDEKVTLREHCKQCAEMTKDWPEWKRNCLGGAPAVERQEPAAIVDESDDGLFIEFIYGEDGNPLRRGDLLYADPPEVIALQSTIAQLEDKLNKAIDMDFQRREEIVQLHARIAELESGQGEPVAWSVHWQDSGEPYLMTRKMERMSRLADDPDFKIIPLYAAPPAPVAVVLPERAAFEQFIISRDGNVRVTVIGESRSYNEPIERDYGVWNACLDAIAALNGPTK